MVDWHALPVFYSSPTLLVVDAVEVLPRHSNKTYVMIPDRDIARVYLHHTAGAVPYGLAGPMATAGFCIRPKKWMLVHGRKRNIGGRGWAGMPYHIFIPYLPIFDMGGRAVVFLTQRLDAWSWHTGGKMRDGRSRNKFGAGVVMQGCMSCTGDPLQGPKDLDQLLGVPSPFQELATITVLGGLADEHCSAGRDGLRCHSDAGKPSCPGFAGEIIVDAVRAA
ncbi:MAG TPA: hypothetical protein ENL34_10245 [Chloroflexi bacterium]|nr:hypothetical protein [Chloroflexota bacterium]